MLLRAVTMTEHITQPDKKLRKGIDYIYIKIKNRKKGNTSEPSPATYFLSKTNKNFNKIF